LAGLGDHHFRPTRSILKNGRDIDGSEVIAMPFEKMSFVEKAPLNQSHRQRNHQRSNDAPHREIQIVQDAKALSKERPRSAGGGR